jgi:hypothetical protein
MTRDEFVASALVVAFAALVTMHVVVVAGLATRPPRWRALVALVAAPLAPYWAYKETMRGRAVVWIAAALAYVVLRVFAGR